MPVTESILVLVESPAKAKTIQSYLGSEYKVLATGGHILDLPPSRLGVLVQDGFSIEKEPILRKTKQVRSLISAIRKSIKIYVATDPDREGEAIAFDLMGLDPDPSRKRQWIRMGFREITRDEILRKIGNPDSFSESVRLAQETRRVLDRLFGYLISPLLWKKIGSGLSAGRVQSVLLRWICEREEEIQNFQPQDYHKIRAIHRPQSQSEISFVWAAPKLDPSSKDTPEPGKKFWQSLGDPSEIRKILSGERKLNRPVEEIFRVIEIEESQSTQYPPPPFKTSTLQEEAYRVLGFPPKKTMRIAQSLYEGVRLPDGSVQGLITYPRTDSVRVSEKFQAMGRDVIRNHFGAAYVGKPGKSIDTKTTGGKGKKIQDAHEAIRPTIVSQNLLTSWENFTRNLSSDEAKLLELVFKRFMASLTAPRVGITRKIFLNGMGEDWIRDEFQETFPGFTVWWKKKESPVFFLGKKGSKVSIEEIQWELESTKPPARYTHGTLVKKMESQGVGRPSTYSPSIEILGERRYIVWEKKYCLPTPLGERVNVFLSQGFADLIRDDFTRHWESELDRVEAGELSKVDLLEPFYRELQDKISRGTKMVASQTPESAKSPDCPVCKQGWIRKKMDRKNRVLLYCSRFPECDYGEYQ